jgi:hypothetical protein
MKVDQEWVNHSDKMLKIWSQILEQREEILKAFVAKYNLQPDEVEEVIEHRGTETVWYLRRKNEQKHRN